MTAKGRGVEAMTAPSWDGPVIIIGSHRSGSSAVAGVLTLNGLETGRSIPPGVDNPRGFFEAAEVVRENRNILDRMQRDWMCPPSRIAQAAIDLSALTRALSAVRGRTDGLWGFKDPRLLFTLDAWMQVLPGATIIGVHRDSEAVAESIAKRDRLEMSLARKIARKYAQRLVELHQVLGFPVVSFGSARLSESLRLITEALGLGWSDEAFDAFFEPDLVHHHGEASDDFDSYLREMSEEVETPRWLTAEAVRTTFGRLSAQPATGLDPLDYVGPSYLGRRRLAWTRLRAVAAEFGEVVEVLPVELGRKLPTLEGSGDTRSAMVSEFLEQHTGTIDMEGSRIVAPDALDAVPPKQLEDFLRELHSAVGVGGAACIGGMVIDDDIYPRRRYSPEEDRSWDRAKPPYLHHRTAVEASVLGSGWRLAGFESLGESGRSLVFLTQSEVRMGERPLRDARLRLAALEVKSEETKRKLDSARAAQRKAEDALANARREAKDALANAERRITDLESRAVQLVEVLQQKDADLADFESELEQAKVHERDSVTKLGALEHSLARLRASNHSLRERYDRLRSRRVVRLALSLASVSRPLFRFWRRIRRPFRPSNGIGSQDESGSSGASRIEDRVLSRPAPSLREKIDVETLVSPRPITVIVPIFNAYEALRHTLDSLVRHTGFPSQLLLIDDASTDARIWPFLLEFAEVHQNVGVLRNAENVGFVETVNRGFLESTNDVVILNSDVEVVPGWLRRLAVTAARHPTAATVTPLSDNAGAFSAPEMGVANEMPIHVTRTQIGRLLAHSTGHVYPKAPTGNGFCMFIRRAALDDLGVFDSAAFPRGYGEENDFCMRAVRSGWTHVVDDSTIVFHERSASFGSEKEHLMARARTVIDSRYPEYSDLVRDFVNSPEMAKVRSSLKAVLSGDAAECPRPRILFAIHRSGGGTPATNADLMHALSGRFESYVLESDTYQLKLYRYDGDGVVEEAMWSVGRQILPTEFSREDYRAIVGKLLVDYDIEVVHIRHLIGHTFDLPSLAKAFGLPVVLSLHDYYFSCPTIHLLDDNLRFCGGVCSPGQGSCRVPIAWLADNLPHLKHAWVRNWREGVRDMLVHVDQLVTASDAAKDVYRKSFPELAESVFSVIAHGRDIEGDGVTAVPPSNGCLRILVPGNLDVHKGTEYIRAIKSYDANDQLHFTFMGKVPPEMAEIGAVLEPYERDELRARVRDVGPNLIGVFSQTAETYSHIVTESWGLGIPVVATDLGAPAERIETHGGGVTIPVDDAEGAYQQLIDLTDPDRWAKIAASANMAGQRSVSDMGAEYEKLYKSLMHASRPYAGPPCGPKTVGLFVHGQNGMHPGSTYVRVLSRYRHPDIAGSIVPVILDSRRYTEAPELWQLDLAVIQRNAVPPELTDDLLETLRDQGVPLIFEIDDDLFSLPSYFEEASHYKQFRKSMNSIATEATMITVSTEPLAEALAPYGEVMVLENVLDEGLWFGPQEAEVEIDLPQSTFNVLYFGTPSHVIDLKVVRPAFERLRDEGIHLWVAGVVGESSSEWFSRVEIPPTARNYPSFVPWLRSLAQHFDLAIAPLVENDFNQKKSDLKLIEIGGLGLPVVCSDVGPYSTTDAPRVAVPNDMDEWIQAVRDLREDTEKAQNLARQLSRYVQERRVLRRGIQRFAEDLVALSERTAARASGSIA